MNKHGIHAIALMCFLLLLELCGCRGTQLTDIETPSQGKTKLVTSSPIVIESTEESPTATKTPISTPIPKRTDQSNKISVTPTSEIYTDVSCLTILSEIPDNLDVTGQLILQDPKYLNGTFIKNMETGIKFAILQSERVKPLKITVSPDRKWLAYLGAVTTTSVDYSLIIRSADGEKALSYPYNRSDWDFLTYWVNNQWLAMTKINPFIDTFITLNPFTGEKQSFIPNYPDIVDDDKGYAQLWPSVAIFDPSFTRLVYIGYSVTAKTKLVLWDVKTSQAITESPRVGSPIVPPIWSFNKNGLIFIKSPEAAYKSRWHDEIYYMNWDGKVTPLTFLSLTYDYNYIHAMSWSPDERRIAFWLLAGQGESLINHYELAIYDFRDNKVTNYCITSTEAIAPIWSPDSQFLAIGAKEKDPKARSLLIDIKGRYAAVIDEDLGPVGWMAGQ